ncbi:beta-glucoside operon transcriptional antiterminator [Enterococcus sp. DIV2402]|uniref:Beta-glucoside operon transcriptional antiterminator n=1 Tax=Candidatus Enterococcus lowellii TaxID=2230877 RepID=A0ABZ2SRS0_9ENTE|nr:PRD domain-containing protein [Enterococcus sp. DIV2402]MBO0464319.1 PRD domain-containing protein [Enterococcus sp. DIV2402]
MKVIKKINNNIVMAKMRDGSEVFVVGRGLGFRQTPFILNDNDEIIEKIFTQQDKNADKYMAIFTQIPLPIINITEKIIEEGKELLQANLNELLLFSLADHINNSVEREEGTDEVINTLHWEIKHIYPTETKIGEYALSLIKEKTAITLPKEESSLIALHFVNAQLKNGADFSETSKITQIIKDIVTIVKYNLKKNINEDSINFARFVTHLRYFIFRQINNESLNEQSELYEVVKKTAEQELECLKKICLYLENNYNWHVTTDEQLYLLLHLKRLSTK